MDYQIILDRMNEELKKYIPGPRDSTWMALDLKTPMTAAFINMTEFIILCLSEVCGLPKMILWGGRLF